MPANPETGIDPGTDRFVVWQESSQTFVNLGAMWPRFDGGAIQGINPDFRYYWRVEVPPPDVDHRFTIATVWGRIDFDPPVDPNDGLPVGEYKQQHSIVKLSPAKLKLQVDAEFQRQVRFQFPDVENPAQLVEVAGALARKQAGSPLTAEQQATLDRFIAREDAIAQLRARQVELYAAIDADEDYDILDGWVPVPEEPEV